MFWAFTDFEGGVPPRLRACTYHHEMLFTLEVVRIRDVLRLRITSCRCSRPATISITVSV